MNAEQLLKHFERISEAPDAIPRLRRFILDLAVRGKLVEQDPEDEPAELLLQCLQQHSRKSGGFAFKGESFPFDLPVGWAPATLGNLVQASNSGWSPKTLDVPRQDEEWGILKVSAVSWERFQPNANKQVLPGTQPKPQAVVKKGDFLISRANTAELVARAVIVDCDPVNLMMSDKIVRLQLVELCEPRYILMVNNHANFARSYFANHATGVSPSMKNVSRDVILGLPLPFPPLAEQHRIVAKVDELMFLCDQLDAAKAEREKCRDSLVAASLQGLNQPAEEEETFREHARFTFNNLPRITTRATHIKQLRQTILGLAVRGKLVEQDPSDEPAEEQLARIMEAKMLHGRKAKATKRKHAAALDEEDDFHLPTSWATAPLADLVTVLNGRAYKQSELLDAGTPVLRVGNLFTSNKWYYSDLELDDDKYCDDGDLIFSWSASFGPFIWNGGRTIYHYHIWKLPLHSPDDLSRDYLYLYLLDKTAEIKAAGHGISMVHMTKEKMEKLEVPLPPLTEQKRIVAKVDELMAICDQLEAQITVMEQDSRRFLESVLADALSPGIDLGAEAQVA